MKKLIYLLFSLSLGIVAQEKPVRSVNNVPSLITLDSFSAGPDFLVEGLNTSNDGSGGLFRYYPTSQVSTNTTNVFKPLGFDGRWIRLTLDVGNTNTSSGTSGTNYYFDANQFTVGTGGTNISIKSAPLVTNFPISALNSGTGAGATTFWRGDGTWAVPAGTGSTGNWVFDGSGNVTTTGTGATVFGGAGKVRLSASSTQNIQLSPGSSAGLQIDNDSGVGGLLQIHGNGIGAGATNGFRITPDDGTITFGPGISMIGLGNAGNGGKTWIGYGGSGNVTLGLGPDFISGTARMTVDGTKAFVTLNTTSTTAINGSLVVGSSGSSATSVGLGEGNINVGAGLAVASSIQLGGTPTSTAGGATTSWRKRKVVTGIVDAVATSVLTVTIPNAAHSAVIRVRLGGSLGAGGAIGANEASASASYDFVVTRTTGVNAVAGVATATGAASAIVAGASTITMTAAPSAISGAVGVSNTFTVDVTISRGSGSSDNHTCQVDAEVVNANTTGVTIN